MFLVLKRLSLGLGLIALCAAVLLASDLRSRKAQTAAQKSGQPAVRKLALLQHASQPVLEDGIKGMLLGLAEKGFVEGKNISIRRFNAEGDMPTANTIAKGITDGTYEMVLTASTPSLQAVASANREGKALHIFALVTDPYGAGVGISRENHLDHPRYMAGYGTMQPVETCFNIAREMYPGLKRVGCAWNPAEANSEVTTRLARKVCEKLGIELLEANVENSAAVAESCRALVGRGAEALWVGGDVSVLTAFNSVATVAQRGGIPVFTVIPPHVEIGALFDVGANYIEVGKLAGQLAGDVLNGKDPATIPIENVLPEMLAINYQALKGLKSQWRITEGLHKRAALIIDENGKKIKAPTVPEVPKAALSKKWNVHLLEYIQVVDVEECEKGILDGLPKTGLIEGKDYQLKISNAQGDVATANSLVDAAITDGADLIITLSTPMLQAALSRARNVPVVFSYCASGVAAGAGKSENDHMPNVTGVQTIGAYEQILIAARECLPSLKAVGTIVVPSEVNTVFHRDRLVEAGKRMGIEVISVAAETSAEVSDAAAALCSKKIDAICQVPGNIPAAAFPRIAKAAQAVRMPLFASQRSQALAGAGIVVTRDYHEAGEMAAVVAARIMRGESPANIPFQSMTKTRIIINPKGAAACGMQIPPSLAARAERLLTSSEFQSNHSLALKD